MQVENDCPYFKEGGWYPEKYSIANLDNALITTVKQYLIQNYVQKSRFGSVQSDESTTRYGQKNLLTMYKCLKIVQEKRKAVLNKQESEVSLRIAKPFYLPLSFDRIADAEAANTFNTTMELYHIQI